MCDTDVQAQAALSRCSLCEPGMARRWPHAWEAGMEWDYRSSGAESWQARSSGDDADSRWPLGQGGWSHRGTSAVDVGVWRSSGDETGGSWSWRQSGWWDRSTEPRPSDAGAAVADGVQVGVRVQHWRTACRCRSGGLRSRMIDISGRRAQGHRCRRRRRRRRRCLRPQSQQAPAQVPLRRRRRRRRRRLRRRRSGHRPDRRVRAQVYWRRLEGLWALLRWSLRS